MESSRGPFHFYAKRLGRLLPGLLACGLLTAAVKINFPYLLAERPVNWSDPFLTALSLPTLDLLRISYNFPDWAYWSLIVEFQFYALIALLLSVVRGARTVRLLVLITLGSLASLVMGRWNHPPLLIYFLPFFVAGMSLRFIVIDRSDRTGWIGVAIALLVEISYLGLGISTTALPVSFGSIVTLTFAIFLLLYGLKQSGQRYGPVIRILAAAGIISYPLYLLHQDIGNTILHILGADCGDIACVVDTTFQRVVVVPISMIALAWMVYRGVERPLIGPLTQKLVRLPAVFSSAMHSALRFVTGRRQ
jgi:peptidoglycan/LPS O-acetylase OafA/YrhL